jgi:membrane protein YdbS with pleckstrin-like domain
VVGGRQAGRVGLMVAGLALLAGTPAVLVAVHVRSPWVLGGALALAAVVVAFGAVWQARYAQLVQRSDEQAFRTQDGCLVLARGRLPRVRDITDPVLLGVHKAAPLTSVADTSGGGRAAGEHVPAYVPRDVDDGLREQLAAGGFVLLVGDSTAGKTRAAFEAIAVTLPGHLLICPADRDAVAVAVTRAAQERQCVLWLDDLERFLGTAGLGGPGGPAAHRSRAPGDHRHDPGRGAGPHDRR